MACRCELMARGLEAGVRGLAHSRGMLWVLPLHGIQSLRGPDIPWNVESRSWSQVSTAALT